MLTGLAGKGGNYALNIGPTAEGIFPEASVQVLEELARWMEHNEESVYAATPTPFADDLPSGPVTGKPGKLYLHLQQWPGETLVVNGIRNQVTGAYLLAQRDTLLAFTQQYESALDRHRLDISLPLPKPADLLPVLVVEFAGEIDVDRGLIPQADGRIALTANRAMIHQAASADQPPTTIITGHDGRQMVVNSRVSVAIQGVVENWFDTETCLTWAFTAYQTGRYAVRMITSALHHCNPWAGGHRIRIAMGGREITATVNADAEIHTPMTRCYAQALTECGEIEIEQPGVQRLTLSADEIQPNNHVGLALVAIQLIPVQ